MREQSDEKYYLLYESSSDAIMIVVPNERFIACNPATIQLFACKNEAEFITKSPAELSPIYQPDKQLSMEKAAKMMNIAMEKGRNTFEWVHKRLNGEEFAAIVTLTKMHWDGRDVLQAIVRDISELKNAEKEKADLLYDRAERVKELNCLYGISKIVEKQGITLEQIFQEIVDLIPLALRYPESVRARILFEQREFKTADFKLTEWTRSVDIKVHGEKAGAIEVFYLENKQANAQGAFLKEEIDLISAVSERLGRIIERDKAEINLKKARDELENRVNQRTKELRVKLDELERFRKATVDREFRMKELRDELDRLKAGNPRDNKK